MTLKTCKQCKTKFKVSRSLQTVCSFECACLYQKTLSEKKQRKEKIEKKKELLTLSDHLKIAQSNFNKWIRQRDENKVCISCLKPLKKGNIDCGHYHSSGGHYNVRFNEDNCHAQCSRPCNKDKSGDLINYRIGLIERIGLERLNYLDSIANLTKKFTIDEVKQINETYKQKLKQ